jgi:hypothetical protein
VVGRAEVGCWVDRFVKRGGGWVDRFVKWGCRWMKLVEVRWRRD